MNLAKTKSLTFAVCFVLSCAFSSASAAPPKEAEARKLVEAYIANIFAPGTRTLDHHYRFESASSEYEESLIITCQRGEPLPSVVRDACAKRLRKGESKHTPSMFIAWAKQKLPAPPHQLVLKTIRRIDRGTPIEGDLVLVELNGVQLEFFRPDDQTGTGPELGRFSLLSIKGVRVYDLLDKDLARAKVHARR